MTNTDNTNQAAPHTSEPWEVDGLADNQTQLWIRTLNRPIATIRLCHDPDGDRANARRLVAAVNACKGLTTEALEKGIIAELRYLLGEVITAAEDLDAAIDGASDQFNTEQSTLNAAIRAARAVLDGGMAGSLRELLAARGQIALVWSIADVQGLRPDLSAEQAWEVLQQVEHYHDAEHGVSWQTLAWQAEDMFGPSPETADEEE